MMHPSDLPVKTASRSDEELQIFRWMALSRALDISLCAENQRWFPVEGEEATIVGAFFDLRLSDAVAAHYRDPFVVYLMRGAEIWRLAAQVLGRDAGYNKGRSVPFTGPADNGIIPWVAGDLGTSLGVATGAALAFSQEGSDRVCVCAFGDGTSNRGDFHENINLAAVWKLPIVYLCQNNGWAISHTADMYLAAPIVARAAGYGIPGIAVDGYDVDAVRSAVREAVDGARRGEGPSLIEARTRRVRGHWAADRAEYRPEARGSGGVDPLDLYAARLIDADLATPAELEAINAAVEDEVRAGIDRARGAAEAGPDELGLEEVYA
jgi:TPP-dependent pyruvate/acetoin dehydrogenase alpha subunit